MNEVKFRYGSHVTSNYPYLVPGSFVYDSDTSVLYIDFDNGRKQITDPLKLSLTGGDVTGSITVLNGGTQVIMLDASSGTVSGEFLQATGNIHLDTQPGLYAVIDENGQIRTRTKLEMAQDLGIIDPENFGELAFKDSATGQYVPVGTITAPEVTINYDSESVVKDVTPGDLPSFTFNEGEASLILSAGSQLSLEKTNVMKDITSITVSTPVFHGTESTITVS